jgi:peroxisomal membrane protein 2
VAVDQLTYGPVCNGLFLFFSSLALERRPPAAAVAAVAAAYPRVQLLGWRVWPLAALINYRYVPPLFRVLFINIVALCWSTTLLLRARRAAGGGSAGKGAK